MEWSAKGAASSQRASSRDHEPPSLWRIATASAAAGAVVLLLLLLILALLLKLLLQHRLLLRVLAGVGVRRGVVAAVGDELSCGCRCWCMCVGVCGCVFVHGVVGG